MLARICRSPLLHSFSSIKNGLIFSKNQVPIKNRSSSLFSTIESRFPTQETLPNEKENLKVTKGIIANVNKHIAQGKQGRLFAIVHVCGKQFKITPEDIIIIEGYWPPKNGDEIKLEKVLLVSGRDFTLVGRPILPQDLVSVKATVLEKDLSSTKATFFKRRRKQYMRINFHRSQMTILRINEIVVDGKINESNQIRQYGRIVK